MDTLRTEIESELKRTRLDKTRLYGLLLKMIDNGGTGAQGVRGPPGPPGSGAQGPAGPPGPRGATGPAGECKCKCVATEVSPVKTTTKKAPAKKKVVSTPSV